MNDTQGETEEKGKDLDKGRKCLGSEKVEEKYNTSKVFFPQTHTKKRKIDR